MPFRAAATGIAAFNILGEALDENYHGSGVGRALENEVERIATEREFKTISSYLANSSIFYSTTPLYVYYPVPYI
jgi:hypothetical protein